MFIFFIIITVHYYFIFERIEFHRRKTHIEDIFVILHFDSPQHFACLHVKDSSPVYYDSLQNNTRRPFSEYSDLRNLGDIKIHEPDVWQEEVECGCMVVLRYWQLFYGKQYNLKGKKARDQVLKFYNMDNNKRRKGTDDCEGETTQIRSRTALTRKGFSSRMLGSSFMKRFSN